MDPHASGRRIHDLQQRAMYTPEDQEVRRPAGQAYDDDGGQAGGGLEQQQISRHHDLFRREAPSLRHTFQRVDRGAIDIRLASFAQPAVGKINPKAAEQRFERRRPTIHGRSLNDLRNKESPLHGRPVSHWPEVRKRSERGVKRSTAISSRPGIPCSSLPRKLE